MPSPPSEGGFLGRGYSSSVNCARRSVQTLRSFGDSSTPLELECRNTRRERIALSGSKALMFRSGPFVSRQSWPGEKSPRTNSCPRRCVQNKRRETTATIRTATPAETFMKPSARCFPTYTLRAKAVAGRVSETEFEQEFGQQLRERRSRSEHRWFKGDHQYRTWAQVVTEAIVASGYEFTALLEGIAEAAVMAHRRDRADRVD